MGSIRLLLAIAVVLEHAHGTAFSGGIFSVQLFFVISGFFISYILVEAQSYRSVRAFYCNRILKLFPVYWAVAIVSFTMYVGGSIALGNPTPFVEVYQALDLFDQILLALTNIFIVGQDVIIFTTAEAGSLTYTPNYHDTDVWVWRGLLVPPAWSLSLELTFYAIAPFILPRLRLLFLLLALSVALRLWIIHIGWGLQDPWNYRFFPTELALFILGALSHQLWKPFVLRMGWLRPKVVQSVTYITIALVLVCVTLHILPVRLPLLIFFVLALPFLFRYQWGRHWDHWVGELSYPVYIIHWTVMFPVSFVWDRLTGVYGYQGMEEVIVIVTLSVVGGILLKRWISDPLEIWRDQVRKMPTTILYQTA